MTRFGRGRGVQPMADDWADGVEGSFANELAALARSADPGAGDAMVLASRSAVLSQFAGVTRRGSRSATVTPLRGRPRAAWALLAAGTLGLAVVGAAVASTPGGPLYEARVATEAIGLPDAPVARERAQADRLAARVGEAEAAARTGNEGGARAGLEAFARIAQEAAVGAVPDDAAASRLAVEVAMVAQIRVQTPEAIASRERARVAGATLLRALRGGGSSAPGPAGESGTPGAPSSSPSASPRPSDGHAGSSGPSWPGSTAVPLRSGAPGGSGSGGGPAATNGGTGGSPSATKAPAGPGGGSGSTGGDGGPSGGPGSGSGSGSGGSGSGRGAANP